MNDKDFSENKNELRKRAGLLRVSGIKNREIGMRLGLRPDQFFLLFKQTNGIKHRHTKKNRSKKTVVKTVYVTKKAPLTQRRKTPADITGPEDIPVVFWGLHRRITSFQKGVIDNRFNYLDVVNKFGLVPTCYLTGAVIDYSNRTSYELDHFVPRCKGGASTLENLRLCTREANRMKLGHLHADFISLCASIVVHNSKPQIA